MIKNKTKGTILCNESKIRNTLFSKARGLMFHKKIRNLGLIFVFDKPRKIDLHMFFVFFPIDVLFLDKNKKVLEIKENFKPFTFYYSKNKASYVIELPKNTVKNTKTKYNDIIIF